MSFVWNLFETRKRVNNNYRLVQWCCQKLFSIFLDKIVLFERTFFEFPVVSVCFINILAIFVLRNLERSTAIGKVINDYIAKKCELDDRAVHLLFSANRWELVQVGIILLSKVLSYAGVEKGSEVGNYQKNLLNVPMENTKTFQLARKLCFPKTLFLCLLENFLD